MEIDPGSEWSIFSRCIRARCAICRFSEGAPLSSVIGLIQNSLSAWIRDLYDARACGPIGSEKISFGSIFVFL